MRQAAPVAIRIIERTLIAVRVIDEGIADSDLFISFGERPRSGSLD